MWLPTAPGESPNSVVWHARLPLPDLASSLLPQPLTLSTSALLDILTPLFYELHLLFLCCSLCQECPSCPRFVMQLLCGSVPLELGVRKARGREEVLFPGSGRGGPDLISLLKYTPGLCQLRAGSGGKSRSVARSCLLCSLSKSHALSGPCFLCSVKWGE